MAFLYVLIAILLVLAAAGYYFARMIIYPRVFPFEEVLNMEVESGRLNRAEYSLWPVENVSIPSAFGYKLFAIYHPLEGSRRTAVLSHGITMGYQQMASYAGVFRRRGFNVLIYDLRHHGRSGGKDTSFGYYEKQDLKTVVDWAFSRLDPGGMVGTFGLSLGAAATLQHAAIDPRIAFAVSDCSFSSLPEQLAYLMRRDYHLPPFPLLDLANLFVKLIAGWTFAQVSPIQTIGQVEAPIFFIHGQRDDYILPRMSEELYNAKTRGIRRLYLAPNAGHAESLANNPVEYDRQVGEFLQEIEVIVESV